MRNEKALQVFQYKEKEIRTVVDGEIWFVAVDVCKILEHSDVSKAVSRLDDDEKLMRTMFASGQNREFLCINEPGLYTLVLTSRKSEAKAFKRWVTHEVIPSIRKTGSYSLRQSAPQAPAPTISDVLRQRAFLNEGRVPFDLFAMQAEFTRELHYMEGILNETLDNGAYPENSVGQCFSPYARNVLHIPDTERRKYRHLLPTGRTVTAWAYPIRYLPDFRQWLYEIYFPKKYKSYRRYRARRIGAVQALQPGTSRKKVAQKSVSQLLLF